MWHGTLIQLMLLNTWRNDYRSQTDLIVNGHQINAYMITQKYSESAVKLILVHCDVTGHEQEKRQGAREESM